MKNPNKPISKNKEIKIPDDASFDIEDMRKSIKETMDRIYGNR